MNPKIHSTALGIFALSDIECAKNIDTKGKMLFSILRR